MVLSKLVASVLNSFLNKFIEDLDSSQLSVGVFSGKAELRNLALKRDALSAFDIPLDVKHGKVGRILVDIPFRHLRSKPVVVIVEDVSAVVGPASSAAEAESPEQRAKAAKEAKEAKELMKEETLLEIEDAHAFEKPPDNKDEQGMMDSLVANIVANVRITVTNVHLRYDDTVPDWSPTGDPLTVRAGLSVQRFTVESTDDSWTPGFHRDAPVQYKVVSLDGLAVYVDLATEDVPAMPSPVLGSGHQFVVRPFGVHANLSFCPDAPELPPRADAAVRVDPVVLELEDHQFQSVIAIGNAVSVAMEQRSTSRKHCHLRPDRRPVKGDTAAWWEFLTIAVMRESKEILKTKAHEAWIERNVVKRYAPLHIRRLQATAERLPPLSPEESKELESIEQHMSVTLEDIMWMRTIAEAKVRTMLKQPLVDVLTRRPLPREDQPKPKSFLGRLFGRSGPKEEAKVDAPAAPTMSEEDKAELLEGLGFNYSGGVVSRAEFSATSSAALDPSFVIARARVDMPRVAAGLFESGVGRSGDRKPLLQLNLEGTQMGVDLRHGSSMSAGLDCEDFSVMDCCTEGSTNALILRRLDPAVVGAAAGLHLSHIDAPADAYSAPTAISSGALAGRGLPAGDGGGGGGLSAHARRGPLLSVRVATHPPDADSRTRNVALQASVVMASVVVVAHATLVAPMARFFNVRQEQVAPIKQAIADQFARYMDDANNSLQAALSQQPVFDLVAVLGPAVLCVPLHPAATGGPVLVSSLGRVFVGTSDAVPPAPASAPTTPLDASEFSAKETATAVAATFGAVLPSAFDEYNATVAGMTVFVSRTVAAAATEVPWDAAVRRPVVEDCQLHAVAHLRRGPPLVEAPVPGWDPSVPLPQVVLGVQVGSLTARAATDNLVDMGQIALAALNALADGVPTSESSEVATAPAPAPLATPEVSVHMAPVALPDVNPTFLVVTAKCANVEVVLEHATVCAMTGAAVSVFATVAVDAIEFAAVQRMRDLLVDATTAEAMVGVSDKGGTDTELSVACALDASARLGDDRMEVFADLVRTRVAVVTPAFAYPVPLLSLDMLRLDYTSDDSGFFPNSGLDTSWLSNFLPPTPPPTPGMFVAVQMGVLAAEASSADAVSALHLAANARRAAIDVASLVTKKSHAEVEAMAAAAREGAPAAEVAPWEAPPEEDVALVAPNTRMQLRAECLRAALVKVSPDGARRQPWLEAVVDELSAGLQPLAANVFVKVAVSSYSPTRGASWEPILQVVPLSLSAQLNPVSGLPLSPASAGAGSLPSPTAARSPSSVHLQPTGSFMGRDGWALSVAASAMHPVMVTASPDMVDHLVAAGEATDTVLQALQYLSAEAATGAAAGAGTIAATPTASSVRGGQYTALFLENNTGFDVRVRLRNEAALLMEADAPAGAREGTAPAGTWAGPALEVKNGQRLPVDDLVAKELGAPPASEDQLLDITVSVYFDAGFEHVSHLPLSVVSTLRAPLKPSEAVLVWTVRPSGRSKVVSMQSPDVVVNGSLVPVVCRLGWHLHAQHVLEKVLQPGEEWCAPVHNPGSLRMSCLPAQAPTDSTPYAVPSAHPGYCWAFHGDWLSLPPAADRQPLLAVAECAPVATVSAHPWAANLRAAPADGQPGVHTVSVVPTASVTNALADRLQYEVVSAEVGTLEAGELAPGAKLGLFVSRGTPLRYRLRIPGFEWSPSIALATPAKNPVTVELPDGMGQVFTLCLEIDAELNVVAFVPAWILNTTELSLEYAQAANKAGELVPAAGQRVVVVEETWENQRWYFIKSWTSSLLPTDRESWSDRDGRCSKSRPRESFQLPDSGSWVWAHNWELNYADGDAEGWQYARNFNTTWRDRNFTGAVVRRRRWQRRRIPVDGLASGVVMFAPRKGALSSLSMRPEHGVGYGPGEGCPVTTPGVVTNVELDTTEGSTHDVAVDVSPITAFSGVFHRTSLIRIAPVFVVVNDTGVDLDVAQGGLAGTKSGVVPGVSPVHVAAGVHLPWTTWSSRDARATHGRLVCLRYTGGGQFSGAVDVSTQDDIPLSMWDGGGAPLQPVLIKVRLQGPTLFVVVRKCGAVEAGVGGSRVEPAPFVVANHTPHSLTVVQKDVLARPGVSIPVGGTAEFALSEPCAPRVLNVMLDGTGASAAVDLNVTTGRTPVPGTPFAVRLAMEFSQCVVCVEHEDSLDSAQSPLSLPAGVADAQLVVDFPSLHCFVMNAAPAEVVVVSLVKVQLQASVKAGSVGGLLTLGELQVDQQLQHMVIDTPLHGTAKDGSSQLTVSVVLSGSHVETLEVLMRPLEVHLEEDFVRKLVQLGNDYSVGGAGSDWRGDAASQSVDIGAWSGGIRRWWADVKLEDFVDRSVQYSIGYLKVYPLVATLSYAQSQHGVVGRATLLTSPFAVAFNTLSAVALNVEDAPVSLSGLEIRNTRVTADDLVDRLTAHYIRAGSRQVYKVFLSTSMFGNPAALVASVGKGTKDFFVEPGMAVVRGPKAFGLGIGKGTLSLLGNTVGGAAQAGAGLTGSVGNGTAALTFDTAYNERRKRRLHAKPKNALHGFASGATELGRGVFGGIAGVFVSPVHGAQTGGVKGFFKGVGKGLAGVVAKPVTGVLDLASQTTRGIAATAKGSAATKRRLFEPRLFGGTHRAVLPRGFEDDVVRDALLALEQPVYNHLYHVMLVPTMVIFTPFGMHGFSMAAELPVLDWSVPFHAPGDAFQAHSRMQRVGRALSAQYSRAAGFRVDRGSWAPVVLGMELPPPPAAGSRAPPPAAVTALSNLFLSNVPIDNEEQLMAAWEACDRQPQVLSAAVRTAQVPQLAPIYVIMSAVAHGADVKPALVALGGVLVEGAQFA